MNQAIEITRNVNGELRRERALLATKVKAPKGLGISALFSGRYQSYNGREPD